MSTVTQDKESELILAQEDEERDAMRLILHRANFRRMAQGASPTAAVPVVAMVGPTGAGKSTLLRELRPLDGPGPTPALPGQMIPTTSNVNAFLCGESTARLRVLDLEGDDGGLPLMEYCKNLDWGAADRETMTADEITSFVERIFATQDEKELQAYMSRRKHLTRELLPRLCYTVADVIVYVNTVPTHRESMYLERVLEFARASEVGIASAERPAMILVHNMCQPTSGSFDVATSTKHFLTLIDRESKLKQSYASVDVVRIPMRQYGDLYEGQTSVLRSLVAQRSAEAHARRRAQGCLFPERVWFSILEKVIEHFASGAAVSMSAIFARFLVSQSSLVNAAFLFFDRGMAQATAVPPATRPALHRALHRLTLAFLALHIGTRALALGQTGLSPTDPQWQRLADMVTARLQRRAVCAFQDDAMGVCIEESSTHGEAHRCVDRAAATLDDRTAIRKVPGPFVPLPDEATEIDVREAMFRDVLASVAAVLAADAARAAEDQEAAAATPTESLPTPRSGKRKGRRRAITSASDDAPPAAADLLFAAMRGTVARRHSVAPTSAAPTAASVVDADVHQDCGVCCARRAVRLLDCGHRMCDECVAATMGATLAPLTLDDDLTTLRSGGVWSSVRARGAPDNTVECLECTESTADGEEAASQHHPFVAPFFAGPSLRPGTGARIFVMEGGGLRLGVHRRTLAALQAELGDLPLVDCVDLVGGSGVGGVAAMGLVAGGHDEGLGRVEKLAGALDDRVVGRQKLGATVLGKVGVWGALGKTRLALTNLRGAVDDATPDDEAPEPLASVRRTPGSRAPHAFALVSSLSPGLSPLLLANYGPERRGDGFATLEPRLPLRDALTASCALSSSFKPVDVRGLSLAEGGLVSNAPSKFALAEANVLFDFPAMDCVVSMGTGLSSARAGIWSRSCDEVVRLHSDAANVAAASDAAHAALTAVLPAGRYLRVNPPLSDGPMDSTTRKDSQRLVDSLDGWLDSDPGRTEVRRVAAKLRAAALAVEFLVRGDMAAGTLGAGLTGGPCWVPQSVGLRIGVGARGLHGAWKPPASLSIGMSLVKVVGSSRAPVGVSHLTDAADADWVYAVSFPEPGVYSLGVRLTEGGETNHIAGSPFLVSVVDGAWPIADTSTLSMPPLGQHVMHFADFFAMASLNLPASDDDDKEKGSNADSSAGHKEPTQAPPSGDAAWTSDERLSRRLDKLGLRLTAVQETGDNIAPVLGQLATVLLGSVAQTTYMLSMLGLWLTAHDHVVVAPPAPLREVLLEVDLRWDTYVAHATTGSSLDHCGLLALANIFGVRFILVSAADSPSYISFIEPRRLLKPRPIIVAHLGGHEYRLAEEKEREKGAGASISWSKMVIA
jgi:hypothetical protein